MFESKFLLWVVGIMLPLLIFYACTRVEKGLRWYVFYESVIPQDYVQNSQLAILEPEKVSDDLLRMHKGIKLAYLSVSEIHQSRSYWDTFKNRDWILGENKNWPGSYRLQFRSKEWVSFLNDQLVNQIMARGFDGLFLDTVDYWQENVQDRIAGVQWVKSLKERYPNIKIYLSNGLEVAFELRDFIDGVVVEDLYTRYDFKEKKVIKTPEAETKLKLEKIKSLPQKIKKLTLLYDDHIDFDLDQVKKALRAQRIHWYQTSVNLNKPGVMEDI